MSWYIGADLGTSSIKLTLMDEKGKALKTVSEEFPISFPQTGWSEQNPADWWRAFRKGVAALASPAELKNIRGLCIDGQMHGLVALDEKGQVIRPAILWNDGRTGTEVNYLNQKIGTETLIQETGNIAYAGFTAPKILWMKKNEPELFKRIRHIMLPKDYIVYQLTGLFSTDYSDAAGTLLFDVKNRRWSKKMLDLTGLTETVLPALHETKDIVGKVSPQASQETGLGVTAFVCAGAADNAGAALGVGAVSDGDCNISLGTSGTIFIDSDKFIHDPRGAIHAFNSASGTYCLLGCMLSAASSLKWLNEDILKTEDFASEQNLIKKERLGHNEVFFLPYLMGERSPINNPEARGLFIGMSLGTRREDLTQAVIEGVSFALRDSFEAAKSFGIEVKESSLTGGGSKSKLWREILASILNIKLKSVSEEYGPSYGMGLACLVADGIYPSLEAAKEALIKVSSVTEPDPELAALYEERYQKFRKIYPAVKELYSELK
jgi:xylulokinase